MAENCAVYVISATVFIILTLTLMSNAFNENGLKKKRVGYQKKERKSEDERKDRKG